MIRIALTGGPCAGKSTMLSLAYKELTAAGYRVFCVPETATQLYGEYHFKKTDDVYTFQRSVLKLQITKEDIALEAAENICAASGEKGIMLFDRGVFDGKAYMSDSRWDALLSELHLTEEALLLRYDRAIYLETVSKAAPGKYSLSNNAVRRENPEQSLELDALTLKAWRHFPHLVQIAAAQSFDEKKERFLEALFKINL